MNRICALLLILGVVAPVSCVVGRTDKACDDFAMQFLHAIQSRNPDELRKLGNNDVAIDDVALGYLISEQDPFPNSTAISAYQLLRGRIKTKIDTSALPNGSKRIEIVYLPTTTAKYFDQLSTKIRADKAHNFVDYLVCSFILNEDGVRITNDVCGAESDSEQSIKSL